MADNQTTDYKILVCDSEGNTIESDYSIEQVISEAKGETGAPGAPGVGVRGPKGDTGPIGPAGPTGPTGQGITIKAAVSSYEELPYPGDPCEAYLVDGDLYIWDNKTEEWIFIGKLNGPAGTSVSMPIGSIMMFAGDEAPEGWLFCRGQVIPTIDEEGNQVLPLEKYEKYQSLISVIKDTYYAYDIFNQGGNDIESGEWINIDDIIEGQTVANLVYLPDFSLRFPYGASDTLENSYLDDKIYGGESSVEVPLPKHAHEYTEYYVNADSNSNTYPGSWSTAGSKVAYNPQTKTGFTGTEGVNGKNPTIDIIPKYTMINFIIKY